jgi:hypothetical protein
LVNEFYKLIILENKQKKKEKEKRNWKNYLKNEKTKEGIIMKLYYNGRLFFLEGKKVEIRIKRNHNERTVACG